MSVSDLRNVVCFSNVGFGMLVSKWGSGMVGRPCYLTLTDHWLLIFLVPSLNLPAIAPPQPLSPSTPTAISRQEHFPRFLFNMNTSKIACYTHAHTYLSVNTCVRKSTFITYVKYAHNHGLYMQSLVDITLLIFIFLNFKLIFL